MLGEAQRKEFYKMEEIQKRKLEIRELLENEDIDLKTIEELEKELEELKAQEAEIQKQLDEAKEEEVEEKVEEEKEEPKEEVQEEPKEEIVEEKKELIESLEKKSFDFTNKEEKMKNKIDSLEYRNVWAKKLMGIKLTAEERALGDAITTTATDYVASDASTQGINNGGLLIPTEVRKDILGIIEEMSPFYRDIRKLAVAGNVDLPYLDSADDAEWYAELSDTKNEGVKFAQLTLTGHELAKNVVVTWKLEAMAINEFISFITQEIAVKMGRALVSAVLYGNGTNKATGALNGLTAVSGDNVIDAIFKAFGSLDSEFQIGAKAYISNGANLDLISFQDKNDNYPYLNGISTKLIAIEVDPFLQNDDILVGNPQNYILNTVQPITVIKDINVIGRKTVYGAYGVFDGKPRTGAFAKGAYTLPSA